MSAIDLDWKADLEVYICLEMRSCGRSVDLVVAARGCCGGLAAHGYYGDLVAHECFAVREYCADLVAHGCLDARGGSGDWIAHECFDDWIAPHVYSAD